MASLRKLYAFPCSGIWIVFDGVSVKSVTVPQVLLPTHPTSLLVCFPSFVSLIKSQFQESGILGILVAYSHHSASKVQGRSIIHGKGSTVFYS